jgi:hypothetical protein
MGSILSWKDVTIKQFQEISQINTELDKIDRDMWVLSILYNKEFDYFETLPLGELAKLVKKLDWMATPMQPEPQKPFKIKGRRFKLTTNKMELLAHQNAAVQKLWEEGGVGNLHQILAYLSVEINIFGKPKKVKNAHDEFIARAAMFQNHLSIHIAMSHLLFFSIFLTKSLQIILPFLQKELANQITEYGSTLPT